MKKISTMIAMVVVSSVCVADLAINVKSTSIFVIDSALTGTPTNGSLAQLVWSSSNTAAAGVGGAAGAGEYILAATTTTDGQGYFNVGGTVNQLYTDADVGGADINTGYIFYRVYDAAAASVTTSSKYAQFSTYGPSLDEYDALDGINTSYGATTALQAADLSASAYSGSGVVMDQSVIPEPATIGLLGIAGAGLFAARRKVRA